MDGIFGAVIGAAVIGLINIAVVSYSYGSLSTKVSAIAERIHLMDDILARIVKIETEAISITAKVEFLDSIVRRCPTCNHWMIELQK